MSLLRILPLLLCGLLAVSGPARAAAVVFDNNYSYNLGTVAAGQSNPNLFKYALYDGANYVDVHGFLPAESKIIFTYTLKTLIPSAQTPALASLGQLYAFGSYAFTSGKTFYLGESGADSDGDTSSHAYKIKNGQFSNMNSLVTTLANFDPTTGIGTTTIINNSSSKAFFLSELDVLTRAYGKAAKIGYAVSRVPLPASLSLFVFAAGVLFFIAHCRKEQA